MTIILLRESPAPEAHRLDRDPRTLAGRVLCAPQDSAVATAQRLFPDHRIEVKALHREPPPSTGFLARWGMLGWMLQPDPNLESPEEVRRRVIDTCVRLVELAKKDQTVLLVAGPGLLRLVAFKLRSIGYRGRFVRGFKPGESREFTFRA